MAALMLLMLIDMLNACDQDDGDAAGYCYHHCYHCHYYHSSSSHFFLNYCGDDDGCGRGDDDDDGGIFCTGRHRLTGSHKHLKQLYSCPSFHVTTKENLQLLEVWGQNDVALDLICLGDKNGVMWTLRISRKRSFGNFCCSRLQNGIIVWTGWLFTVGSSFPMLIWLGVWNIFHFPIYWE